MPPAISTLDTLIVLAYLAGTVALGLWIGRGNRNVNDYLLGSRDLPWWALLGSIVATETSTATFLSVPGESFKAGGDFQFLQLAFGYVVGRIVVSIVLLPGYFRGQLLTAYQLLQQRFGVATRRFASALFLVARNLGDGLRLYLAAIALNFAIGLSLEASILIVGVLTIVYTLFGGMRSVVWNDCLQLVVYLLAGIATLWIVAGRIPGGFDEVWSYAVGHEKLRVFDFAWKPDDALTFWAGLIGGACFTMGTHGTDQIIVQRFLAARNQRDAAKALIVSGFVVLAQFALFLAIGVGVACVFDQFPPARTITKNDEAYALFIVTELPAGLTGLTLAGVFAAAMSTLSSSLNSSAAALIGDFGPLFSRRPPSPARQLRLSRLFTVLFGGVQIGVAMAADDFSASVVNDALAIAGFTSGILLGVFCLGLLPVRVTPTGALVGMVSGLIVLLCVKFGPVLPWSVARSIFRVSVAWPWYPVIGSVTTVVVGTVVSVLFPLKGKQGYAAT